MNRFGRFVACTNNGSVAAVKPGAEALRTTSRLPALVLSATLAMLKVTEGEPVGSVTLGGSVAAFVLLESKITIKSFVAGVLRERAPVVAGFKPSFTTFWAT